MLSEKVNDIYEIMILMTSYFFIQLCTWYPSKNELKSKTTGTWHIFEALLFLDDTELLIPCVRTYLIVSYNIFEKEYIYYYDVSNCVLCICKNIEYLAFSLV